MSATAIDILENVALAIESVGEFAEVSIGTRRTQGGLPRASVELTEHTTRPADDGVATWHRLRLTVAIVAAGAPQRLATYRAMQLCRTCQDALQVDEFRAGLARHLPWGRATQFGPTAVSTSLKPPMCELLFEVICHYETAGDA